MRSAPLSELASLIDYGVTASATKDDNGPKFLRITDIQDGAVDWASVPFCDAGSANIVRSRLAVGDIVFARTGATTGKSFLIRGCPENAVFASYLIRVRAGEKIDPGYLAHFFDSPEYWRQIAAKSAGAAQPGVNASKLGDLVIPFPPLLEQKRIAAILDQADTVRRIPLLVPQHLQQLRSSEFDRRFNKIEKTIPFSLIVSDKLIGLVRSSEQFGEEFAVPYIRMDAISRNGEYLEDLVQNTNVTPDELDRYRVSKGDLLFNTRNSRELVGKSAIFSSENEAVFNNNVMRVRFVADWNARFVDAYLRTPRGAEALEQRKSGTTSVWAVYWSKLKDLPVPSVSAEDQLSFCNFVEELDRRADLAAKQREYADALFISLQHRAFRGEL